MHLSPCKERGSRNWVPGHGGGAAPPILARPTALPAGRGHGEECMLTKGPLTHRTRAGRHSTTAHGGDRRGRPQRPRFRRDRRTEWTTRDARGTRGSRDGAQTIRWLVSVFKPFDLHGRYPQQGRRWGSPWSGTRRSARGHKTQDLYRFG
jgi:hypothetical protein